MRSSFRNVGVLPLRTVASNGIRRYRSAMSSASPLRFTSRHLAAIALIMVGCSSATNGSLSGVGGTIESPDLSDQRHRNGRAGTGGVASGAQAGTSGQASSGSGDTGVGGTSGTGASSGGVGGSATGSSGAGGSGAGGRASGGAGGRASGGGGTGGRATGGGGAGGRATGGGGSAGSSSHSSGSGGVSSGGAAHTAGAPSVGGQAGAAGSPQTGALSIGSNSVTNLGEYTNSQKLDSKPIDTNAGSTLLVVAAMGKLANLHPPTDNNGDTFTQLLPAHNYAAFWGSGQQLFAATNIKGGKGTIVTESMPNTNDEVSLSVVEIRGAHSISAATVSETPGKGPVTSASVTTKGPAMLVSWWWGDGVLTQISATTSDGWTRIHSLGRAQGDSGMIQTELAAKAVNAAGTYSITWTSNPDQGAVVYLVALE